MKKGISQRKVQRMRNLATKNYGAKTVIQSGYGKKSNKHVEGDVWEERGKSWTIKNGIKQSITKLDGAREHVRIPLNCPKCGTKMNKTQHKFMYVRFEHCLFCQTNHISEMNKNGTYTHWQDNRIFSNFDNWLIRSKIEFEEWLKTRHNKNHITEAGLIEDWSGGQTDDELRKDFENFIDSEKEKLIKIIGEQK